MNSREIKEKKELIELLDLGTEPTKYWETKEVSDALKDIHRMATHAIEKLKDVFERSAMEFMISEFQNENTITAIMHNNHVLCELFNTYPNIKKSVRRLINKSVKEDGAYDLPLIMDVITMSKKEHLKFSLKEDVPLWVFENYELSDTSYVDDVEKIEKVIDEFVDKYHYDEYGDIEDYDVFESDLKRAILKKLGIKE